MSGDEPCQVDDDRERLAGEVLFVACQHGLELFDIRSRNLFERFKALLGKHFKNDQCLRIGRLRLQIGLENSFGRAITLLASRGARWRAELRQ